MFSTATRKVDVNIDYYIRILVAYTDDANITPNSFSGILVYTRPKFLDDELLSEDLAAPAKLMGDYIYTIINDENLCNNTYNPGTELSMRPVINEYGFLYKISGVTLSVNYNKTIFTSTGAKTFIFGFNTSNSPIDNAGLETDTYYTLSFDLEYLLYSNDLTTDTRNIYIYLSESDGVEAYPSASSLATTTADAYKLLDTVLYDEKGIKKTTHCTFTFKLKSTTKRFRIAIKSTNLNDSTYKKDVDYMALSYIKLQKGIISTKWVLSEKDQLKYVNGDSNTSIINRNNPDNTLVKLQQLNRATRTGSRTLGTPPLCLIHFSDIHGDEKCLNNIIDFKNYYDNYIADILHTGDSVTSYASDGMLFWDNVDGAEKILNVIGNHDTRVGSTWIGLSMQESYNTYFQPYIDNWNVQYSQNTTYYYKDYPDNNVRLIVIDIMHQNSNPEQLTWFQSTLSDAIANGLHVIAASHSRAHWLLDPYETPWDDKPIVNYGSNSSDQSESSYPTNLSDDYATAVDTFINNGGEFICWLHGHTHYKIFAKLQTHPNQLNIAVANAGGTEYAWTYVWNRITTTKSEDDFNILAIDTYSKILRVMKVGVDYDIHMRHTDTISYNYGTKELLYTN